MNPAIKLVRDKSKEEDDLRRRRYRGEELSERSTFEKEIWTLGRRYEGIQNVVQRLKTLCSDVRVGPEVYMDLKETYGVKFIEEMRSRYKEKGLELRV